MIAHFHDPFAVLLVHHPQAGTAARALVQALDRWLTAHNPANLLVHGSSLPTYIFAAQLPANVLDVARRPAVVLVADDSLARDPDWCTWADSLFADTQVFAPMLCALTHEAASLLRDPHPGLLDLTAFADATTIGTLLDEALARVTARLLHALPLPPGIPTETTLLISHDVRDPQAGALAQSLLGHINALPQADRYFTRAALPPRTLADDSLRGEAFRNAAVIVLHTDGYSASPWCQHDILFAKRCHCSALIVDACVGGEPRHFPYLGNVRSLHQPPRQEVSDTDVPLPTKILAHILRETLFDRHTEILFDALRAVTYIPDAVTFTRAPEFATLAELATKQGHHTEIVIYPDPPLVRAELDLLRRYLDADFLSLTQAIATTGAADRPLTGRRIALSISRSPDLHIHGRTHDHVQRVWLSLARHLLDAGATLAYGGDLRPDGYTAALADLSRAYTVADTPLTAHAVRFYLAWSSYREYHTALSRPSTDDLGKIEALIRNIHQLDASVDPILCLAPNDVDLTYPDDTPAGRTALTRSLTVMRQRMAAETDARILLGGQHRSTGTWPGLLEEALEHLRQNKPLYLIGAYGGMTGALIDALKGHPNAILTDEFQSAPDDSSDLRRRTHDHFNTHARHHKQPQLGFSALAQELAERGPEGLQNGLTATENHRLFTTPSLFEQVALVLHGLRNLEP